MIPYSLAKLFLFQMSPEKAHHLALWALKNNIVPACPREYDSLRTNVWGIDFANPVGIAGGFDKNAEVIDPLSKQGVGFVEVGSVTPLPQSGNPLPRLFRLVQDRAVINRMGMNNRGMEAFAANLAARKSKLPIGANLAKNKTSEDAVADYVTLLKYVYPLCDYFALNISSPNTLGLRKMQEREQLESLLIALFKAREELQAQHGTKKPILVKVAPDNSNEQLEDIADVALQYKVDGLIVTNTSTSRPDSLLSAHKTETGGLSGAPIFELATETLRIMYRLTKGSIPLVGVGGIMDGEDAYIKIKAGASLVQLYSGLVYEGMQLVQDIKDDMAELLAADGFTNIAQAVGSESA